MHVLHMHLRPGCFGAYFHSWPQSQLAPVAAGPGCSWPGPDCMRTYHKARHERTQCRMISLTVTLTYGYGRLDDFKAGQSLVASLYWLQAHRCLGQTALQLLTLGQTLWWLCRPVRLVWCDTTVIVQCKMGIRPGLFSW